MVGMIFGPGVLWKGTIPAFFQGVIPMSVSVDGSEIRRSPVHQLRLVVYPFITRVLYIAGG